MLKFLLKSAGFFTLAGAFAQVVVDGARSVAGGAVLLTPLGALVEAAAPGRAAAWRGALSAFSPSAGTLASATLGILPAGLALALVASLLLLLARPRRPATLGYEPG
jgi:hypothetical protein